VRNLPTTRRDADGHDGGTAPAVWEIVAGGFEGAGASNGFWTVGSVALPGLIGGGVFYSEINYAANTTQIVANAEMQYQVALNNLAATINEMARAGKSTEQLRKEWEKLTGQKWPQDPNTGKNQDCCHKKPRQMGVQIQRIMLSRCLTTITSMITKRKAISNDGASEDTKSQIPKNQNRQNRNHRSQNYYRNRSQIRQNRGRSWKTE